MKKLFFLGACLVALASSPVKAQTGGVDVVVVKVFEASMSMRIAITHGQGKTQVIETDGGGSRKSNFVTSAETLQRIVADLYQRGYTLKSTFGTDGGNLNTLVFVKG